MNRPVRRAVVLGGAGFLGSAVVKRLQADQADVTVVERRQRGIEPIRTSDVLSADLVELFRALDPDVVFHFATTSFVPPSIDDPFGDMLSNVGSTVRVLDAARRLSRPPLVVIASSAAVYGHGVRLPMDEGHPCAPLSPYGAAKLAAENYMQLYHRTYGLPAFSVRPFSLYGPGLRKQVVFDLASRVLASGSITTDADPTVERDFVYVDDAAEMICTLASVAPARAEAYNICSGTSVSIGKLAGAICAETGAGPIQFSGVRRPGDPGQWRGDPSAAAGLGAFVRTTLESGLRTTVAWILSRH